MSGNELLWSDQQTINFRGAFVAYSENINDFRAGYRIRTGDLQLGKLTLYR